MTSADLLVPAAQYLRMSTEHQQYSFENHSTAIQKYAGATLNSVHAFDTGATFIISGGGTIPFEVDTAKPPC
jgi:hypothetical protein